MIVAAHQNMNNY